MTKCWKEYSIHAYVRFCCVLLELCLFLISHALLCDYSMSVLRTLNYPSVTISNIILRRSVQTSSRLSSGIEYWWGPEKAAGREVVGHGFNGDPVC